jgi:hypothetical protein
MSTDARRRRECKLTRVCDWLQTIPRYLYIEIIRRHGKSQLVMAFAAVNLYFCPGDRQILLSIGSRVSKFGMKEYVKSGFMGLPGAADMVIAANSENFEVRSLGAAPNQTSTLSALPMKGATRGFNAFKVNAISACTHTKS